MSHFRVVGELGAAGLDPNAETACTATMCFACGALGDEIERGVAAYCGPGNTVAMISSGDFHPSKLLVASWDCGSRRVQVKRGCWPWISARGKVSEVGRQVRERGNPGATATMWIG